MNSTAPALTMRAIEDKSEVAPLMLEASGSRHVLVAMHVHDISEVEATGLYGQEGQLLAFAIWALRDKTAYLCALHAVQKGQNYARTLLAALIPMVRDMGARTIRAMTSNDNIPALGFYQKNGFRLTTLYVGGIDAYRPAMPGIRTHGYEGIPIRDALELEMTL